MNATIIIRRAMQIRFIVAAVTVLLAVSQASAITTPNLLVDPSFENPALTPFGQIIGPPFTTGVWGGEVAANVTGPVAGISPASGLRMHRMDDDGGVATQSWQLVDLSPYTTAINAGNASVNFDALFNVPANVAGGIGSLVVSFFTAAQTPVPPLITAAPFNADSIPPTWQSFGLSGVAVPPTTQYVRLQLAFANASMQAPNGTQRPGFVDDARLTLTIVPEPSTIGLGSLAMAGLLWLRKRR